MIKFDKNEFLKPQIYSTLDEYESRCNVVEEIIEEIEQLQQENQELKKQLKNYKKLGFKYLQDKNNNLEAQQKEFIEYLEKMWKETQDIWYIKILQKYKEIIGGKDVN